MRHYKYLIWSLEVFRRSTLVWVPLATLDSKERERRLCSTSIFRSASPEATTEQYMPQVYKSEANAYGYATSSLLCHLWLAMIWKSPAQEPNVKKMDPATTQVGISLLRCVVEGLSHGCALLMTAHDHDRPHL